jgi:hypothetical protein
MNALTTLVVSLWLAALASGSQAGAADLALPRDGWTSWKVDAVEGAPAWCCWNNWNDRAAPQKPCQLDGESHGYGSRDGAHTDAVRVYARFEGGKLNRLRVLAANCPVESATPIAEITTTTDDSARWLIGQTASGKELASKDDVGEEALIALALHRGERAQAALTTMALSDTRTEKRKRALFWLSMLRGAAGADTTSSVMFNDKDREVRKHGAFAISQSKSPRAAPDLIRLGNTDKDGDVRGEAWFWLAQTGAANSEEAIVAALRKDGDAHVREKAIHALAQLPEERATRALIKVAEDRTLSSEQRKRAVFWLAQSEEAGAQAYLEKVLAVSVAK